MTENNITDMHFHVGLNGDQFPAWGKFLNPYKKELVFKTFLLFNGIKQSEVNDADLEKKTLEAINSAQHISRVVCLALDQVYDKAGNPKPEASNIWIHNDYILHLQEKCSKILMGASVHPYAPDFESRVGYCVKKGAVLLKWLPSAQQIDLANEKTLKAMKFLAKAKNGKPLPLLLHIGPEYAIPSTNPKTASYDYLSWSMFDSFRNFFHFKNKMYKPDLKKIHSNIKTALDMGAIIIFAHIGLPYFSSFILFEHSDFKAVKEYLEKYPASNKSGGRCFADVSACVTPFRKVYFKDIKKLPKESLLFGSDFPTPVFELSAGFKEAKNDFKAILKGHLERIIVPQDNLLDVNYVELSNVFTKEHKMFSNFNQLI